MNKDQNERIVRAYVQRNDVAFAGVCDELMETEEQLSHENQHEERRYNARIERFALAVFRKVIEPDDLRKNTDWPSLAREAVRAAHALEEALNPTPGTILPEYVP